MYPDFKEFLSTFNAHRVKYLIVGATPYSASVVSFSASAREPVAVDILPDIDGVDFDWGTSPSPNLRRTVDPVYELWLRPYRHR
jgi:hypothetical protein